MKILTYLDPQDSLSEILFGLIMVLTFTLGAGVAASQGGIAPETLIYGAIGCNVAWGIIDAVFYLMGQAFVRGTRRRMLHALARQPNEKAALHAIADELDPSLQEITSKEDRESLYRSILKLLSNARPQNGSLRGEDFRGAIAVFVLVSATSLPAALPFLFINDPWLALRLSNTFLISLLFIVGYRWARYTETAPWLAGLGLTFIGVCLVGVAIALGG